MSTRSTLDPDVIPGAGSRRPPGHDTGSLGPSDRSDTGSDTVGPTGYDEAIRAETGDSVGTGVDPSPAEPHSADARIDIGFDRVVPADEAGLGGGLDQAEEARYGVTDEELDPADEAGAALAPDGAGLRSRRGRSAAPDVERDRASDGDAAPDEAMLGDADDAVNSDDGDDGIDAHGDAPDDPDAR